jgi:hypothetical protein
METDDTFEININGLIMNVTSHLISGDEIFHIVFSDGRPPLVVHEAFGGNMPFWTSIPQGRQKEAAFFGAQIAEHFKK